MNPRPSSRRAWVIAPMLAALFAPVLERCSAPPPPPVLAPVAPQVRTRRLAVSGAASSLSRITQSPIDETQPALSPDGQSLMFVALQMEGNTATRSILTSIDPSTGARRTIFTPERALSWSPRWMPDGTSLVYVSNRSGPTALVRSLSASPNSGVAILMDENQAASIGNPFPSPDGLRIVAHALIAGTPSIIMLDNGRSQYAVLGEGETPSFDPAGVRVAFTRRVGGASHVFTMRASDGTDLVQVTQGDFSCVNPTYSPDGRYILFASNRSSESPQPASDGRMNLFAIRVDGSDLVQITDGDAANTQPFWGADRWIYFQSNQAGNFDIWRLRPEGNLGASGATRAPSEVPQPRPTDAAPRSP